MHVTLVEINVHEDKVDEFIEVFRQNHLGSVQEEGNLRFDVLQDPEVNSRFYIYEAYKDEDAVAFHKTTPHYKTCVAKLESLMTGPRKKRLFNGLAVQMPDNWLEPTHVLMREVAWEQNYPDRGREPLAGVHAYYDILSEAGCEVDIWRTTYYHQMPSHQAIIDWVTATGLRPWLQDLTESEQQLFLKRYHQMLEEQYPLQENGQILLAFPRLFIVARRME